MLKRQNSNNDVIFIKAVFVIFTKPHYLSNIQTKKQVKNHCKHCMQITYL